MKTQKTKQGFSQTDAILLVLSLGILVILMGSSFSVSHKIGQPEARQYIGSMNRAQQAYFIENNQFSSSIEKLGIGIKSQTKLYNYSIKNYQNYVLNYAIPKQQFYYKTRDYGIFPWREKIGLDSYVGGVWWATTTLNGKTEKITQTIFCKTNDPSQNFSLDPTYKEGNLTCPTGTTNLNP